MTQPESLNPYQAPAADPRPPAEENSLQYVGFWLRVGAAIIDTILVMLVTWPILLGIYGDQYFLSEAIILGPADFLLSWVFPMLAVIVFWMYRSATPGKMVIRARIVDARSGMKPSTGQWIGRYLGYFISTLPLGLGLLWVAWDPRKQGWHDKLARTVVVRPASRGAEPAVFPGRPG